MNVIELLGLTRLRRHHAIEHATIAVLFRKRGQVVGVVGRSDFTGFHIFGPFTPEEIEPAVQEAISRLRNGERDLAITPFCGTNIALTGILAGGTALIAAGRSRREGWPRALTAAMVATLAAARIGQTVQRYITTDANVGNTRLAGIHGYDTRPFGRHLKVYLRDG